MGKIYDVAVIVKAVNSDFWQTLLLGAGNAMKDYPEKIKVSTYGPPEESDIEEQVKILEKIVAEGPDAIVIASTSNDLTVPAIEAAMGKGIPVITIDNKVNTEQYVSFLATDNFNAAADAAGIMAQNWIQKGIDPAGKKFVVFNSMKESKVDQDRDNGFIEGMRKAAPEIEMIDIQFVENSAALTEKITKELLEKEADLIGIFADNDQTGVGVAKGIAAAGKNGKVTAYAFDAADTEIEALKNGGLDGLVVQDPYGMGYKGVMCAVSAIEGKAVEKSIDTGATIVTLANFNDDNVQKLLYPSK